MPRKKTQSSPPPVMTWGKASLVIIFSIIFDALRFMFTLFWFFGPELASLYCATKVGDVWVVGELLKTGCAAGAVALGYFGFAFAATFGTIMAMAVGFAGWLIIGAIIVATNSRIFKKNALWFGASLLLSEIPFLGALPAFTAITGKMYWSQIKEEEAVFAVWQKEQADIQARERQEQIAQMQMYIAQQEAANDDVYNQAANDEQYNAKEILDSERDVA